MTAVGLKKNVTSYDIFFKSSYLVRTSTAHRWRSSKKITWPPYQKKKSNNLEPHFPTSATKSRSLEDTKTAAALPHCNKSTRDLIAGWWIFLLEVMTELWRNYGTSYVKKTEVEVLPVVDLSGKSVFQISFCGRCSTVYNRIPAVRPRLRPWRQPCVLYRSASTWCLCNL